MDEKRVEQRLGNDIRVAARESAFAATRFFAWIGDMKSGRKGSFSEAIPLSSGSAAREKEEDIPWAISVSKI